MISLSEEYVISKFYRYCSRPKHNRYNNTYQGECPICFEGKSRGKARRCYYIPSNNNVYCHNCGWSSTPFNWVKEITGKTNIEVIEDVKDFSADREFINVEEIPEPKKLVTETLPTDSINLSDPTQLSFYRDNSILNVCMAFIKRRRLDTAVNRPDRLYLSLTDFTHKNRLVIPFINERGSIEFYQSRTLLPADANTKPKYLSRVGADKTLFNINKVSGDYRNVFIFEGPLNAFFTKNSVAVAGITQKGRSTFTPRQQQQATGVLKWLDKIWVLDSQWVDNTSLMKSEALLKEGEKVFIWPENFGKRFKDFNDICMALSIDEISHDFIEKNTSEGIRGILKLAEIKRFVSLTH